MADLIDKYKQRMGRRLKSARESRGLTQKEVAQLMGYKSAATVSNHESGTKEPKAQDLQRYADFYGTTISEFYGSKDDPIRTALSEYHEKEEDKFYAQHPEIIRLKNDIFEEVMLKMNAKNNPPPKKHIELRPLLMITPNIVVTLDGKELTENERYRLSAALSLAFKS